jgi:basic amino acid/polyamine antiporter, APA family
MALREIRFPERSLVAMVSRGGSFHVPRGSTVLREGDRITVIGEPDEIGELYEEYVG